MFLIGYQEPNDKKDLWKNIIDNNISNNVTIKNPMVREELKKYYCSADLFVFPSINEGSPRVLKEALSCGTPALVSDLPGNRIVDNNSNILSFFQPNNNKELSTFKKKKYRILKLIRYTFDITVIKYIFSKFFFILMKILKTR